MTNIPKKIVKELLPPIFVHLARSVIRRWRTSPLPPFIGPVADWEAAIAASDTWDADTITQKTLDVSLQVKNGKIRFQQDTIPRDRVIYSELILAFLAIVAQSNNGRIDIIDFGGSLATNYFQNRQIVSKALSQHRLRWLIVERPDMVRLGVEHFETEYLRFFETFSSLKAAEDPPNSILFSGSLQMVPKPLAILEEAVASGAEIIAFDRLLISNETEHSIFIQNPDPAIYYKASYPVWVHSRKLIISQLKEMGFVLVEEFPQLPTGPFRHVGMLYIRGSSE